MDSDYVSASLGGGKAASIGSASLVLVVQGLAGLTLNLQRQRLLEAVGGVLVEQLDWALLFLLLAL